MSDKEIKLMHACKQLDTKTTSYVAEASMRCHGTPYAKSVRKMAVRRHRGIDMQRKIPEETIDTVISFIKNELRYNPAHAQEACAEELGIVLSVCSIVALCRIKKTSHPRFARRARILWGTLVSILVAIRRTIWRSDGGRR